MARLTVSQRLRGRLRALLSEWGTAAALARYSQASPAGTKLSTQEISYFVNETPGRKPIGLDDLDDIAAFFRVSLGELLGETRTVDLRGDEQRMVYAFRALPPTVQEHFLALIEQASLTPRGGDAKWAARKRSTQ